MLLFFTRVPFILTNNESDKKIIVLHEGVSLSGHVIH